MKAYAYLRVSGKGQIEGDGFTRQLGAIKSYAAANGIKIVEVYREEGFTGTTESMNRPAWVEMIGCILADGVKTVLIEKLDRLARDLMVQEHIIRDLRERGITLISAAEPDLCSDDPTRKLLRQIMGAIAEYDKSMIVLKLRGARQRIRARGERCEGRKPYGAYSGESRVLARMRELRDAGMGFDRIAEALNAEGPKPRIGQRWWGKTINNILSAQEGAEDA